MEAFNVNDLEGASRQVLAYLSRRIGFGLWMITRTIGNDWIVLQTDDGEYSAQPGTVLRWSDSMCSAMVQGLGPRIAPDVQSVPAYSAAPIAQKLNIGAHIGVPITLVDGSLFGTLCAIDPLPQPESLVREQELIELQASLLSIILQADLRANEQARASERFRAEAISDALTHLYNRRGWDRLISGEEERCRRHGHSAAVFVFDLDRLKHINDRQGHAAGDQHLIRAARALSQVLRAPDIIARLGGDEFGILSVECDRPGAELLAGRFASALAQAGVDASMGFAMRNPTDGMSGAWKAADLAMFERKRSRNPGS
ncbi:MAG TPA: sensor domain-containing diguanylate cyclase [Terracidiphilus sp.]|nr:sensor domain-containing diguanylate cyclase [Terracidiphilus sp.]